jgi:hypothetical protein
LCSKCIYIFYHFTKIIWELVRQFIIAYTTEMLKNLCIKCIVYNFNCQSCFKASCMATSSAWNQSHSVLVAHIPIYWYWYTPLPVSPCSIIGHRTCQYKPSERYIHMCGIPAGDEYGIFVIELYIFCNLLRFFFGWIVTFQSFYSFGSDVIWNILPFPTKFVN